MCPPSGLLITAGRGDAAMGYREMTLTMKNCGSTGFTLDGRPDITVLDADRQPMPIAIVASTHHTAPPKRITLRPGVSATAVLAWRNTYDDTTNAPAVGSFLSVAPAAGAPRQIVDLPSPLDLGSTGRLQASAWF